MRAECLRWYGNFSTWFRNVQVILVFFFPEHSFGVTRYLMRLVEMTRQLHLQWLLLVVHNLHFPFFVRHIPAVWHILYTFVSQFAHVHLHHKIVCVRERKKKHNRQHNSLQHIIWFCFTIIAIISVPACLLTLSFFYSSARVAFCVWILFLVFFSCLLFKLCFLTKEEWKREREATTTPPRKIYTYDTLMNYL